MTAFNSRADLTKRLQNTLQNIKYLINCSSNDSVTVYCTLHFCRVSSSISAQCTVQLQRNQLQRQIAFICNSLQPKRTRISCLNYACTERLNQHKILIFGGSQVYKQSRHHKMFALLFQNYKM